MATVLKISDGLEVPDVEGKSLDEAIEILKDAGFKSVDTEMSNVAHSMSDSNKVNRVVYVDDETSDWKEIPSDGRLSATDKIILYYYGEFVTTTQATTSENKPEPEPTTESQTETSPATTDVVEDEGFY